MELAGRLVDRSEASEAAVAVEEPSVERCCSSVEAQTLAALDRLVATREVAKRNRKLEVAFKDYCQSFTGKSCAIF